MRGKYRKGKGRDDGSKMKRRVVKVCVHDVSVGRRCQTRVIHDYTKSTKKKTQLLVHIPCSATPLGHCNTESHSNSYCSWCCILEKKSGQAGCLHGLELKVIVMGL